MSLLIRMLSIVVLFAAMLFLSAGRLDLPWFWVYLAPMLLVWPLVGRRLDPGLVRERISPGPGGVDRNLRWIASPFLVGQLVVAGLDARFGWSGEVGWLLRLAGLAGYLGGLALSTRALLENRFFSPVVRIQSERGHTVVTTGPYAIIRHPGYAAMILGTPWSGLLLGSWWSLLAWIPLAGLMLRRLRIEDRYLQEHLPGYREYAARVRWRLCPGVW